MLTKNNLLFIKILFIFVGIVEFVLGPLFIFFPGLVFELSKITPIARMEYIQFPALLIMVFGLMMFSVARNPVKNVNLIPYICLFKVSFISVVFYNWFTRGLSQLWIGFSFFDIAYLIGFLLAYKQLRDVG